MSSVIFIMHKWGYDLDLTISDHVSKGRSRQVYAPMTTASLTLFLVFMLFWLLPELEAPTLAYLLMAASYATQMVTTIIPRTKKQTVVHDSTASLSGLFMVMLLVVLAVHPVVGEGYSAIIYASVTSMVVLGAFLQSRARKYYAVLQGVFFTTFGMNIAILTYLVAG